ncbi:MAG: carboxypeptidase regulatory-like domain-containing protein [Ktedonobacteraceae bacterium]|nr:carboxypeptidase regulatory-like domain-containing protein [Ktedonobacteraceae bacterium]
MECSEPGTIRDEELLAYLAGEQVRPTVIQHLKRCQRCTSQLAAYRNMDFALRQKLYRCDCPPNLILGEYHLGLLDSKQAAEVQLHLRACIHCAAEISALAQFLALDPMQELAPAPAPAPAPASSRSSLQNHRAVQEIRQVLDELQERSREGIRRIAAVLLSPPLQLAVRDVSAPAGPRRYEAEDVRISLQVEQVPTTAGEGRHGQALQLVGFVHRKGQPLAALQGTQVRLWSQTGSVYSQTVDELGNFVFPVLAPAIYTLELQCSEEVVVIEQLPITQA